MPRNYQRKSQRQSWSEENMQKAISSVSSGELGYLRASRAFHIPKSTLKERVSKLNKGATLQMASAKELGRYKPVFAVEQEKELVEHILQLESKFFDVTRIELRRMAYEFAVRKGLESAFNSETKMAGSDWLHGFLKRNNELSLCTPEKASLEHNKMAVRNFFIQLKQLFEKYKFSSENIYNADEKGISTVTTKMSQVLTLAGKKQVTPSSSTEHGDNVTIEICMSASGKFMPPMFIFPSKTSNPILIEGLPPGSSIEFQENGWMCKNSFLRWFKKFVEFSNPSAEKVVLLLLNGHSIHIKSLEFIDFALESNVIILCFPAHWIQPLDVSIFMDPLSTHYCQKVREWLSSHPRLSVTIYQVARLFGSAFIKAATTETAINSFKIAGIYPLDEHIFPDSFFEPSETTKIVQPSTKTTELNEPSTSTTTCSPIELNQTSSSEKSFFKEIYQPASIDLQNSEKIKPQSMQMQPSEDRSTKRNKRKSKSTIRRIKIQKIESSDSEENGSDEK